ncbi:MAG: glycine zipper 2TM domain-containing protein [Sulfuritalea sp.]|jgi:outer membrane lipoprotein SlyB|nr:glycine zipper 2TM domain-containing protein [Sulfuritalea sp.]
MNAATIESLGTNVETRSARPKLLYPALVIAAISVTLFSLLGIAALTGVMPSAHSTPQAAVAAKSAPTGKSAQTSSQTSTPSTHAAAASCVGCGTVESIATVERPASTTGVGAVAGGLTGALLGNQMGRGNGRTVMTLAAGAGGAYLGNRIEQNTRRVTSYKIVVRMENGSQRTVYQTEAPSVAVGGQVQIVGNSVVART